LGGSGSTALASLALKRQFITIELDKTYHQIITERIKEILEPTNLFATVDIVV
jgi:DNA modification methylase